MFRAGLLAVMVGMCSTCCADVLLFEIGERFQISNQGGYTATVYTSPSNSLSTALGATGSSTLIAASSSPQLTADLIAGSLPTISVNGQASYPLAMPILTGQTIDHYEVFVGERYGPHETQAEYHLSVRGYGPNGGVPEPGLGALLSVLGCYLRRRR
jgi:hypothetical protein